jgi:hypothetical protein
METILFYQNSNDKPGAGGSCLTSLLLGSNRQEYCSLKPSWASSSQDPTEKLLNTHMHAHVRERDRGPA